MTMHDRQITDAQLRRRAAMAEALCRAIAECDPADAAQILAAALDDLAAGDPPMSDPFGGLRADAQFWADCAHPAELECYFASALERLGNRALGIISRKRLFAKLWASFSDDDRRAFLHRVDPEGQFHGRAAA